MKRLSDRGKFSLTLYSDTGGRQVSLKSGLSICWGDDLKVPSLFNCRLFCRLFPGSCQKDKV